MVFCVGSYKKYEKHRNKYVWHKVSFIALGTSGNKIMALKVQPGAVLSNKSILRLRSAAENLMKLSLDKRLSEIKRLVPEWNKIYRTYSSANLKISSKEPLKPISSS